PHAKPTVHLPCIRRSISPNIPLFSLHVDHAELPSFPTRRSSDLDGSFQDFVVDTGAENTVLSRPTAQRLGVTPVTYTLSAGVGEDRKSTRLNSSHLGISYAVFCLKKKTINATAELLIPRELSTSR